MLAPISWLKDFVDINVSPETLAKKLVAIGFEVEEIFYQSKQAQKVVTGKILSVEKHPSADRLRVAQVDVGKSVIQVVTNVAVEGGENVAVALDGAVLAGGATIKRGELRGVLSEGMLCGLEEVGVEADAVEGQVKGDIIRFADGTALGQNTLVALGYDDVVLDVAVTANRPDCNGIYRLAKEVAVALGKDCREPEIAYTTSGDSVKNMISVEVRDNDLCPRYMAGGVRNVRIFPSPLKIRSRLRAVGIRPINNIVDITNYVLTEIGQPMHAFDRDYLAEHRIVVRRADEGEHIITLDGKDNVLTSDMLTIRDGVKPVAVAGVMGGENSGINDNTTEIIFESARFARDSVRRTSRALNLRSDSSARYEKGVDFSAQEYGLKRALTLVCQTGSGDVAEDLIDVAVAHEKDRKIAFTVREIEDILGCKVPVGKMKSILSRLGIAVEKGEGKTYVAHIPDAREDIALVNDIAEEFIRVYGYSHIEPTLFAASSLTKGGKPEFIEFRDTVKETLVGLGFDETITYSFISPSFVEKLGISPESPVAKPVPILNPLGENMSVMRTTLLPSMIETLAYNAAHFNKSARLFEAARVYFADKLPLEDYADEKDHLVIGAYGDGFDFFALKGAVEGVLDAVHAEGEFRRSDLPFLHPGRAADVYVGGVKVGYLGEIHPDTASAYDAEERLYCAEIDLAALNAAERGTTSFVAFSKYPPAERDLAVVVADGIPAGDMLAAVKNGKIKNLVSAEIFDVYKGAQVGEGKKSVALGFAFASPVRTLTDEEIAAEMKKILGILKRGFAAEIRR